MQIPQQRLPFSGPLLSNDSPAHVKSLSPAGSQMSESSTHQIADSQPPEAAPVPEPRSQTDQSCISSHAVQESQNVEDCFPAGSSVQEKQIFVKEEIASLAPVPSVGEHYVYSRSKHPPKEKEKLKIYKQTEAYLPKAVQHVLNLYNAAVLEDPKKQNAALHHPACPSLLPSVEIDLEFGHTATERELPTKEGYTHDLKVYVQGTAGCAIEPFVSTVAFRLPPSYPRPIRARREPPFEINVSGCAEFTVAIYIYFRTKEEPIKITYSYHINLKNGEVSEARRRKLIFQNPGPEFRKKLLLGGGVPCMTVFARNDSPCITSSSTFIPNELATSPFQSQESDSVIADATRSTVKVGEWCDGILTIVYDNQQNESFPSPTGDSGHSNDMLDFYRKVFKIR